MAGRTPIFTSIELYRRTVKLQLPFTSIVEEFKAGEARLVMTLKDSGNKKLEQQG